MKDTVLTHAWQDQGLGKAPFRVSALICVPSADMAATNPTGYNNAMGEATARAKAFGVTLCTCEVCGMSLSLNVVVRDADGKHFVVGQDCAAKAGDAKVVERVVALERKRQSALRAAKREEANRARQQAREAELARQREANGGMTDAEKAAAERRAEADRAAAKASADNAWLTSVLARVSYTSGFVADVLARLGERPLRDAVRGRAVGIVAEIYAKTKSVARKGSKAYAAAEQEFYDAYGPVE